MTENPEPAIIQLLRQANQPFQLGMTEVAIKMVSQARDRAREHLGDDHPLTATCLNNLAVLHQSTGDYLAAAPLFRQALEIRRTALGEDHPEYAQNLNNLATISIQLGDYAAALPVLHQALEIRRRILGENHPDYAVTLDHLVLLRYQMGDYQGAEPLARQAVKIFRATLGGNHPSLAKSLNNLAALCRAMHKYPEAERAYRQALEIRLATLGKDHPEVAGNLNGLALLQVNLRNFTAAEELFKQALEIRRQRLGENHPSALQSANNLAALYRDVGNFAEAEPLFLQALENRRQALGENHPSVTESLLNLAILYAATDRLEETTALFKQAMAIDDLTIDQVFSISSENQRMAYLGKITTNYHIFLSLVNQSLSDSPEAVRAALDLVLRRKALGAEALAVQRDAVLEGRYPELRTKLQELGSLKTKIAHRTLEGPGAAGPDAHRKLLARWNDQMERLESELAQQIPEPYLARRLQAADVPAVACALPEGTTLLEFVCFREFDFKAVSGRGDLPWKPARYVAFALPAREPHRVRMIDLGEAEPVDREIARFRASITGGDRGKRGTTRDITGARICEPRDGEALRAIIFDKLADALGSPRRLLIAPDGDLTRVPFEVLPTERGHLIDDYQIHYVAVGRDVLRFHRPSTRPGNSALVVADPDFDLGKAAGRPLRKGLWSRMFGRRRAPATDSGTAALCAGVSRDLDRMAPRFKRLPGTRREGERIGEMLGVQPWLDDKALKRPVRNHPSPSILHIASHGFFLEDQSHDRNPVGWTGMQEHAGMSGMAGPFPENPLLRSGLALAGANGRTEGFIPPPEAENGLLTAEDVAGMDLLDTELAVLSACETGLGEVRTGEGVFGLRRAFAVAGATTLVMSLWKVPDEQTRQLMEDFYRRIQAGEPRAEALRGAQLAMREMNPHPIYWGAFICQGDPGPLPGKHRPGTIG